mgnify:CR=1 FL=1
MSNITLSESAAKRIKAILEKQPDKSYLRVSVEGGGCSGFQYGFTFDEDVNEEFTKMAYRRIRLGLLLSEIGNKQNMQVSEGEIREVVLRQASMNPEYGAMLIDNLKNNPEARQQVAGPILEDKVVKYIKEQVQLKVKTVNSKELMEIVQKEES